MFKKLATIAALVTSLFLVVPITIGYAEDSSNFCSCSSIVGDKDNFGIVCGCDGMTHEAEDGDFDSLNKEDKSWTHTFAAVPTERIVNAKLTINAYYVLDGKKEGNDLELFVDGVQVPNAFDDVYTDSFPYSTTIVFNLDSALFEKLSDGSANVEVKNAGNKKNSFAIDYARLDLQYICRIGATIDIKPGSDPSSFGVNSKGKIPVALFGSSTVDVTQVDDRTVRFGNTVDGGAAPTHYNETDVNGDGILDKVYHFPFQETNFNTSDTVGYLSGQFFDGLTFLGSSDIKIAGKEKSNKK
jgi:hypothetical protein